MPQHPSLFDLVAKKKSEQIYKTYSLETATGKINFAAATAQTYSIEDAIARLHDLHLRAWNDDPKIELENDLSSDESKRHYDSSLYIILIQIGLLDSNQTVPFLSRLTGIIQQVGNSGGLEPVFYSALTAAALRDVDAVTTAYGAWGGVEHDPRAGGGSRMSMTYDVIKDRYVTFDAADFEREFRLNPRGGFSIGSSPFDKYNQLAMDNSDCTALFKLFGGVKGAAIGALAGAGAGALVGVGIGVSAGDIIGSMACPRDKPEKDDDVKDEKPAEREASKPDLIYTSPYIDDMGGGGWAPRDPYEGFGKNRMQTLVAEGPGIDAFIIPDGANFRIDAFTTAKSLTFDSRDFAVTNSIDMGNVGGDFGQIGNVGGGWSDKKTLATTKGYKNTKDFIWAGARSFGEEPTNASFQARPGEVIEEDSQLLTTLNIKQDQISEFIGEDVLEKKSLEAAIMNVGLGEAIITDDTVDVMLDGGQIGSVLVSRTISYPPNSAMNIIVPHGITVGTGVDAFSYAKSIDKLFGKIAGALTPMRS